MVKNRVKEFRKKLGLTIEELSEESHLSAGTLFRIEQGENLTVETAFKLAEVFGCKLDDLFFLS